MCVCLIEYAKARLEYSLVVFISSAKLGSQNKRHDIKKRSHGYGAGGKKTTVKVDCVFPNLDVFLLKIQPTEKSLMRRIDSGEYKK